METLEELLNDYIDRNLQLEMTWYKRNLQNDQWERIWVDDVRGIMMTWNNIVAPDLEVDRPYRITGVFTNKGNVMNLSNVQVRLRNQLEGTLELFKGYDTDGESGLDESVSIRSDVIDLLKPDEYGEFEFYLNCRSHTVGRQHLMTVTRKADITPHGVKWLKIERDID